MPHRKNEVWNHFEKLDSKYAKCKYCNSNISYKATSANLKSHLRKKHGLYESTETKKYVVTRHSEDADSNYSEDSEEEVWEAVISEEEGSEEDLAKGDILKIPSPSNEVAIDSIQEDNGTRKPQRPVWTHFDKISNTLAICKYCGATLSYKSTTGNLNTHMRKKHSTVSLVTVGRKSTTDSTLLQEKITKSMITITNNEELGELTLVQNTPRKTGRIWRYFEKVDDEIASCNQCGIKLSYKASTGNLSSHYKKKHPFITLDQQINDEEGDLVENTFRQSINLKSSDQNVSTDSTEIHSNSETRRNRNGRIWAYFDKIDDSFATCKYCVAKKFSYKSSTGNLGNHLKKKHPNFYLIYNSDEFIKDDDSHVILKNVKSEKDSFQVEKTMSGGIWKYFYKQDNGTAICKYCSLTLSYKTLADLSTHFRKSHTSIYMAQQIEVDKDTSDIYGDQTIANESDQDTTENNSNHDSTDNESDQDVGYDDINLKLSVDTKKEGVETATTSNEVAFGRNSSQIQINDEVKHSKALVWKHFNKIDDQIAKCKYCNKSLSYRSSTGNLNRHLKKKHKQIYLTLPVLIRNKEETWIIPRSNKSSTPNQMKEESYIHGEIWTHFDKIDDTYASCRYCSQPITYNNLQSTGNLISHLKQQHSSIYMAQRINNDSNIVWICNDSTQDEPKHKRQKIHHYTLKLPQEEKRRSDRDLLGLFIYDYQSLSIVEDSGFLSFVTGISEYSPPSKKNISKMIQALYEKTVTELKEIVARDVISVCLTTECWTSSQEENYLAITAHYTDTNLEPHLIQLECTSCNGDRTGEILTREIKRIINEWDLSAKVIFAIADDSQNTEHAIETLGWNGYGCYSHALNLIFLNALKPVEQLIEDMNKIIMNFKNNTTAMEMLTSYQMRNITEHEEPKEFITQALKNWYGTFFTLQRFVQLSEAIQYCMALEDTEWPVFTEEEWELAKQLYEVIQTFEEVISSIRGDQYMNGSLVIIITNCLNTICDDFLEKDNNSHYKAEIKEVISYVKDILTERFSMIEFNKDFALCTLLDPRFKSYGFNNHSALAHVQEHLISLLTDLINSNESSLIETVDKTEKSKDVSAWDRFDQILKQKKPQKNSSVKAERELQMYLDDEVMPRKNSNGEWNSPVKWWRDHKIIYPNLSEIYRTRCNVVATSVPWNNLYSKKGQIMSERRSILKSGEVEKLVFLNANLDKKRYDSMFKKIQEDVYYTKNL